jgi:hypothetical protein
MEGHTTKADLVKAGCLLPKNKSAGQGRPSAVIEWAISNFKRKRMKWNDGNKGS